MPDDAGVEARILWRHPQLALALLPRGAAPGTSWGERPLAWLLGVLRFFLAAPGGTLAGLAPVGYAGGRDVGGRHSGCGGGALTPQWLGWAMRIQAIAQTGLHYAGGEFDRERYGALRDIAAEMMASRSGAEPEYVRDLFAREVGHATPKLDVRGVVFRDDALLLVRERSSGRWALPGGFADVGESAGEATVREVREESGYEVRASRLLALYDRAKHNHTPLSFYCYKVYFACALIGGTPTAGSETAAVGFFRRHELPELCPSRVTPGQLKRMWHLHHHPELGADFD